MIGNHRLYEVNFFENLHVGRVIQEPLDKDTLKVGCIFLGCCYIKYDITAAQKKGANHGSISLYLAPESDEWEEIECDEADQIIAINNHVCPHQQPGEINILRV